MLGLVFEAKAGGGGLPSGGRGGGGGGRGGGGKPPTPAPEPMPTMPAMSGGTVDDGADAPHLSFGNSVTQHTEVEDCMCETARAMHSMRGLCILKLVADSGRIGALANVCPFAPAAGEMKEAAADNTKCCVQFCFQWPFL
jgi:hypothetical protein